MWRHAIPGRRGPDNRFAGRRAAAVRREWRVGSGELTSTPVAKPEKRNIESGTDKVMPKGKPREAVRKVTREPTAADGKDAAKTTDPDAGADTPRRTSKRVTPKSTPAASTRYTPPTPHYEDLPSPLWVPVLMFSLFALGMLTIFFNYVELVLPGATSNWYLLLGLGFILGGIITATQFR